MKMVSFLSCTMIFIAFLFFRCLPAQAAAALTGERQYLVQTPFAGWIPITVNFTTGVISGTYGTSGPVLNPSNPGKTEFQTTEGIVDGTYSNGTVDIALSEAKVDTSTAACGSYSIKTHAEYTLTGLIAADGTMTQNGAVASRYKLDASMVGVSKKIQNDNVPPTYDVQCGSQSSGYGFLDKNLAWMSSTLKGSSGTWTATVCTEHQEVKGYECVCKAGQDAACKEEKAAKFVEKITLTYPVAEDTALYTRADGTEAPLTSETVLQPGDSVFALTENVTLNIGDQRVTIYQGTSFKLEAIYLTPDQISKTRVLLMEGAIKSKILHVNAIRSDFYVATPGANSSIRGSEMVVMYDEATGVTTTFVTEDEAFVQGINDAEEVTVSQGQKIVVGSDGKAGAAEAFDASELPVDTDYPFSVGVILVLVFGGAVMVGLAFAFRRWRAKRNKT